MPRRVKGYSYKAKGKVVRVKGYTTGYKKVKKRR
jgi:hypothetical protein